MQAGRTAVMIAALGGHTAIVEMLLDKGACVYARNKVSTVATYLSLVVMLICLLSRHAVEICRVERVL